MNEQQNTQRPGTQNGQARMRSIQARIQAARMRTLANKPKPKVKTSVN